MLKTSSGKIRRRAVRERFEQERLGAGSAPALPLQILRLGRSALLPQLRRASGRVQETAWAAWFWMAIGFAAMVAWPVAVLGRSPRHARALLRRVASALLALTCLRLRVEGAAGDGKGRGRVLVFNHASYVDGLVLSAALDPVPRYVVKSELRRFAFSRLFLAGIGCLFVERFERTQSSEDARAITTALADGAEIGIFAEGTLHRMPGLLPFQLGAFRAAVEANAPVVPVVLRGTRSVLRNESWFPRRGIVRVLVGEAIDPASIDPALSVWERSVRLRDATRKVMLRHCGEPDLARSRALLDLADRSESSRAGRD